MADINGNFFYRESAITTKDIYRYTGRIRRNSYVTVTGKVNPTEPTGQRARRRSRLRPLPPVPVSRNNNSESRNNNNITISSRLPITGTSFDNTYKPNGKNNEKPAAVLQDVSIKLEGTAGSLRRCEVNFLIFNKEDFDIYEKVFLSPGCEVDIEYGYVQPSEKSALDEGKHTFRVYDFSFELTKENNWNCSFKGVGKGTHYELLNINVRSPESVGKGFITDFSNEDEKDPIFNFFDWLDFHIQERGFADRVTLDNTNSEYIYDNFIRAKECGNDKQSEIETDNGENAQRSKAVTILMDSKTYTPKFNPDTKNDKSHLIYFSLQSIIGAVNEYALFDENNENKYVVRFHPSWSKVNYEFDSGVKVWSAQPLTILIPYSVGSSYNYYGIYIRDDSDAGEGSILTIFNSAGKNVSPLFQQTFSIPTVNELAIDNNNGHPGGILIHRDFLRAIENTFYSKSTNTDSTTEEEQRKTGKITMQEFFVKLFQGIRDATAGAWDFELQINEEDTTDNFFDTTETTVWIVNKKSPVYSNPTNVPVISPATGSNGVREISLNGKIPKEIQARIFAGGRDSDGSVQAVSLINDPGAEENNDSLSTGDLAEESALARIKLASSRDLSSNSATSAVRTIVNSLSANEKLKRGELLEPIPYPLELSITLDGIEGFSFGDTIRVDYLPDRYTTPEGTRIEFTILSYEHKFSNNDWETTLTTGPRLVTDK